MIEARVFVDNLASARLHLWEEQAELNGYYIIHDTIYRNVDPSIPLEAEFLRLRDMPKDIWDEGTTLTLKQTELRTVGKNPHVPFTEQFRSRKEAEEYYEEHYKDTYTHDFDCRRVGWQFFLPDGDVVDLEIIEDSYPSIEFKSKTDDGIKRLLGQFAVHEGSVIKGPSVVAIRSLLQI